jgi:predicted O-methyltransferase YrrM
LAHDSISLQKAFKYLFPAEVPALKDLARSLPPNPVVINIGAGAGTSGLLFMESRPDLFLYTIDIQRDNSPFGCLFAEEQVLRAAGFGDYPRRWMQFHGDSKEYGKGWQSLCLKLFDNVRMGIATHKVDFVFIDGDHSYEGCKGDIEAWLPNIKPGGIIAIHDYKKHLLQYDESTCPHPRPWPGVDRAVDELLLMGGYEMVMYVESLIAFRVT